LGDIDTAADTTFTVTEGYARGDIVRLGLGDSDGYSAPGKKLVITNMDGYANFYINTDLANNKADTITMTNVVNATEANKIYINYDPTLATGTTVTTNTTVATVGTANTATFEGEDSTIGGYSFKPTVTTADNGLTWSITGVSLVGSSEQMYTVLGNASAQAAFWRQSGLPVTRHLAQLRLGEVNGNDFWVNYTRGKNTIDNQGHGVRQTYNQLDIGYDRYVGHDWTVGAAYGLRYGTEGYVNGSGDSHDDILTAYGMWQGNGGRYGEISIRAGRLASDFSLQDQGMAEATTGSNRTYGQALSFTYGQRMDRGDNWYIEPHAGLQWAHVNGYSYGTSDGSTVSIDGSNSFIAQAGITVGRKVDRQSHFYARADVLHDFAGGVQASMTRGMTNTLENDFKDTWLDVAFGYRRQAGPINWYVEAARLGIASKAAQGNWVVNCGLNYSF
jgi:outer membrane autotransporter protein